MARMRPEWTQLEDDPKTAEFFHFHADVLELRGVPIEVDEEAFVLFDHFEEGDGRRGEWESIHLESLVVFDHDRVNLRPHREEKGFGVNLEVLEQSQRLANIVRTKLTKNRPSDSRSHACQDLLKEGRLFPKLVRFFEVPFNRKSSFENISPFLLSPFKNELKESFKRILR